jgi:hypothetical protein
VQVPNDLAIPRETVAPVPEANTRPSPVPMGESMHGNTLFSEVVVYPVNRDEAIVTTLWHWVFKLRINLIYIPFVNGIFLNKS